MLDQTIEDGPAQCRADLGQQGLRVARFLGDESSTINGTCDVVIGSFSSSWLGPANFSPCDEQPGASDHAATVSKDAPFPGVPILVKDIALELAGYPYGHGGLRLLRDRDHVSDRTTYLAAGLRDAGFAFLGRGTTALQGMELGVSNLALHSMPRNPWNTDYSTGGSSSGSAAAVAAGLVPLAHGNDGGGSLRMPAAMCGLVTLKPTRGRVSPGPLIGAVNSTAHAWIEEFVLTRTVRDTAAVLPLLSGRRPGDPFPPIPPLRPAGDGARLRIGITTTPFMELNGLTTDPALRSRAGRHRDLVRPAVGRPAGRNHQT